MRPSDIYSSDFYHIQSPGSKRSAQKIVPLVLKKIRPQSVIDIGCGVGTWLSVFRDHGVEDYLGIDGPYVDRKQLLIEAGHFMPANLEEKIPVDRKFDLLISLEVVEHIQSTRAAALVKEFTRLSDVILFSAAVPYQGGYDHVNEQWPQYWVELFANEGLEVLDNLRPLIWIDAEIDFWYRQNIMMFATQEVIDSNQVLQADKANSNQNLLALVHPEMLKIVCSRLQAIANEGLKAKFKRIFLRKKYDSKHAR